MERSLFNAATERIDAARLQPNLQGNSVFAVHMFEETIAPTDARPPFSSSSPLTLKDVSLAAPIDGGLMQALFPPTAMRYSVNARVTMTCRIENPTTLLCRDPGTIAATPADIGEWTSDLITSLRWATYQLASTLQFQPRGKDGKEISGRDLAISIVWQMPE